MMWSRWDVVSGGFSGNFMGSCFSIRLPPIFCKNHGQVKFYHNLGECMLSLIGNFTGWHELFNNPICTHLENVYLMPWESTARRSESNQTRLRSNWNLRPWWMTPIILNNLWLDWGDGVRVATCRAKAGMWTSPSIRSGTILIPGRNLQSQDVVLCRFCGCCFLHGCVSNNCSSRIHNMHKSYIYIYMICLLYASIMLRISAPGSCWHLVTILHHHASHRGLGSGHLVCTIPGVVSNSP